MKTRPILFSAPMVRALLSGTKTQTRRIAKLNGSGRVTLSGRNWHCADPDVRLACPNGQPGDRLYVKEAIRHCRDSVSYYDADNTYTVADAWPWKRDYLPSMFCPQGLSRITLEIISVRVERLQDISEADAMAEGVQRSQRAISSYEAIPCFWDYLNNQPDYRNARDSYASLWESINGPGSWDANPLVWAIEFKRIEA